MSSYVRSPYPFLSHLTLACAAALVLTACNRGAEQSGNVTEVQWARAALERNPQIELIATDPSGVFTIRDKGTGEVRTVRLGELAAAPIARLTASTPQARPASVTSAEPAAAPIERAPTTTAEVAEHAEPPSPAVPAAAPVKRPEYTVERVGGQTKVSGPGISIVSTPTASGPGAQREPGRRSVDPFICEGRRMIHFDNRKIYVDGDAVTARDGCELYITNSHIVASGTGVVVRDAVVHIANSYVEGASASFAAEGRAKMYVRGSTFEGLSRRDSLATIQDQGGNEWR